MRAGRAQCKIENETFNTLKNQGYNFQHNYGHGYQNLCSIMIMLRIDIGVWESWHLLYTFIGDPSSRPPPIGRGWLIA